MEHAADAEPPRHHILIVDDDASLRTLIRDFLNGEGFAVDEAEDAPSMRRALSRQHADIIILDVMMPGEDGLSIARSLTDDDHDPGVIMVSALGTETDRITGLEAGADDYLPKPVSPHELLARIRALLRRRQPSASRPQASTAHYHFEGWQLDPVRRVLRDPAGVIFSLSDGEFSLLLAFIERPQQILNRDQLLELARGQDSDAFDRAIDTQVSRLRRKLGTRTHGEIIRTIRSEGYMFLPPVLRA